MKTISFLFVAAATWLFTTPGLAQRLVDPTTVAPEYRGAAEKRRAEQIRQLACGKKADDEKVMPRERTEFINHCMAAETRDRH